MPTTLLQTLELQHSFPNFLFLVSHFYHSNMKKDETNYCFHSERIRYYLQVSKRCRQRNKEKKVENPGIDPGTSRMQSGRSTI